MIAVALVVLAAGYEVSGKVVDDTGRPVAGAEVRRASGMRGGIAVGGDGMYAEDKTTTDAAGLFAFHGVEQKVALEAHAKGHGLSHLERVELPARRAVVLRVRRLARVVGRVTLDGKPFADAHLAGLGPVDAAGAFDVFVWLRELGIHGEGVATKWLEVNTAPGAVTDLGTLALERGLTVELVIPLEGRVYLTDAAHLRAWERLSRSDVEEWREQSFSADDRVMETEVSRGVARFLDVGRGPHLAWGGPAFPPTEVMVRDRPVRLTLSAVAPAVLEVDNRAAGGRKNDFEPEVLVLECGGRFVRVKLEPTGLTTAKVAPGACRLPTPFRTFDKGVRTLELKAGATTRAVLIDAK